MILSNKYKHGDYIYYLDIDTNEPVVGKVVERHKLILPREIRRYNQIINNMDVTSDRVIGVIARWKDDGEINWINEDEAHLASKATKLLYA